MGITTPRVTIIPTSGHLRRLRCGVAIQRFRIVVPPSRVVRRPTRRRVTNPTSTRCVTWRRNWSGSACSGSLKSWFAGRTPPTKTCWTGHGRRSGRSMSEPRVDSGVAGATGGKINATNRNRTSLRPLQEDWTRILDRYNQPAHHGPTERLPPGPRGDSRGFERIRIQFDDECPEVVSEQAG